MRCHVFQEHERRARFVNNAQDLREQMARIALALPLSGEAERLARVARKQAIHDSTPWAAIEGSQVTPERSELHGAVRHARRQDSDRADFPLNVADDASAETTPFESGGETERESIDPAAQAEDVEGGRTSHMLPSLRSADGNRGR